jgi:hypothetical protein
MLLYYLLFSQDITPFDKCPLLHKVERSTLPAIPTIQFVLECRIMKVPLAKEAPLV